MFLPQKRYFSLYRNSSCLSRFGISGIEVRLEYPWKTHRIPKWHRKSQSGCIKLRRHP
ncbi:unknown protein [Microcystis aeruginosa NIES-843]|uniref:Uncharacterized protein n=1 Tax=Microcystis aeruginosa (strain NIES-843 / IAM M-2473) TaxID=449447 RepID=B0JKK6_MICAN|nr:unknown protein [Microcystis aeruginosa NIES-843]